jgi:hypothetical protein
MVFVIDDQCDRDGGCGISPGNGAPERLFASIASFWHEGDEALLGAGVPLHRAASDLRERLRRCGASRGWMRRFAEHLAAWFEGVRAEEQYKKVREVPHPVDLMALRPDSGAVLLFMHFIEVASGMELSSDALADADVTALQRLAGRIAIYPNEVWSYKKESESGHVNLVTSMMKHCGLSLTEAVIYVAETHNAEMMMFDAIVSRVLHKRSDDAPLKAYLLGLHHFLHGLFLWGWHATRYSKEFFHDNATPFSERPARSQQRLRVVPGKVMKIASR